MRSIYAISNFSLTALLVFAVLCALAQPAYAYVDPGSGLFAFQIISTTMAGMIFMLRSRLRSILRGMTLRPGSKNVRTVKP
jgi:hypothetical protein